MLWFEYVCIIGRMNDFKPYLLPTTIREGRRDGCTNAPTVIGSFLGEMELNLGSKLDN
jgi:hypothetical protein